MALDSTKSLEIIEIMENYISKIRPKPEIRNRLDSGYELIDQSIVLQEIRPKWDDPSLIMRIGYTKATFVQLHFICHLCIYLNQRQIKC